MITVKNALNVQNRTVSYREAEVLLGDVLAVSREWLYANPDAVLTKEQEEKYLLYLNRREKNEPVAYITGVKEFYSRPFKTDSRALIPRPETEGLIDLAIKWAQKNASTKPLKILELGTGCGNIAITLNLELQKHKINNQIIATDIDANALELAKENSDLLATDKKSLEFIEADLFQHPTIQKDTPYNLIIANLPYVPTTWKMNPIAQQDVLFYEPDIALFGGEDGLDIYRCFFQQVAQFLASEGIIIIEFSEEHGKGISELGKKAFPEAKIKIQPDYAGLDRVLVIET